MEELKRILQRDPTSRQFLALAEEYRRHGKLRDAIITLERGLALHSSAVAAHVALGKIYQQLDRFEDAIRSFTNALRIDRENLVAIRQLAEVYLARGDRLEAVKKLKLYRGLKPGERDVNDLIQRLETELAPPRPTSGVRPLREDVTIPAPILPLPGAPPSGSSGAWRRTVPVQTPLPGPDVTPEAAPPPWETAPATIWMPPEPETRPGFDAEPAPAPAPAAPEPFEPAALTETRPVEATAAAAESVFETEQAPPAPREEPSFQTSPLWITEAEARHEPPRPPLEERTERATLPPWFPPEPPELSASPASVAPEPPAAPEPLAVPLSLLEAPTGGRLEIPVRETLSGEGEAPAPFETESPTAPLVTETLAELYRSQGYAAEAQDAYRALAAEVPDAARADEFGAKAEALAREIAKPRTRLSSFLARFPSRRAATLDDIGAILRDALQGVEGLSVAALTDREGLSVVTQGTSKNGASTEVLVAELTSFVRTVGRSRAEIGGGKLRSLALVTEKGSAVLARVSGDYALILQAGPDAALGEVRWAAAKAADRLRPALG